MTTATPPIGFDAFARQDRADTNFDTTELVVRSTGSSAARRSYLYFPVVVPSSATILTATLTLTHKAAWTGGADTLTVSRVTQSWKERQLTYTNAPSITDTNAATAAPNAAADATTSIDIADMVTDWVAGAANYGLRLSSNLDSTKTFYSSEAVLAKRPTLTIVYTTPAAAPTNLRPDGGSATSLEEPLLTWQSATPAEVQLQIDTADTFDSQTGSIPEWDTGFIAWTQTSYPTIDADSPPLLVDGTTYYWRVRIRDANEVTSDWAGAAQFAYHVPGTLTITTPAADDDNVETTSPVIAHTFTGQTQASVEYLLYEDDDLVYTRNRTATTDTSYELPAVHPDTGRPIIRNVTSDYSITVRVWDDRIRSGVGAAAYVEATRVFQFAVSATPDPVTAFTATGQRGHVALAWSRAAEPDYFAIEVDGDIVEDRINASDAFVSGTAYAWNFYRATPRTSQTYKVHAVTTVSGVLKMPDDSPSDADTFAPPIIYLVDETARTEVGILGEGVTTELGESGATFFPIARQDPVRIVDIVRGHEGTVTGEIAATYGQTVATAKSAFFDMKENPGHAFRLIYGYRNIPVTLGDARLALLPWGEEAYAVSFDFWQTGEFEVVQS